MPLLTPVLFALVIAPALKEALHTSRLRVVRRHRHDRPADPAEHDVRSGSASSSTARPGAQRELLAAPISRALLPLGNLDRRARDHRAAGRRAARARPGRAASTSTSTAPGALVVRRGRVALRGRHVRRRRRCSRRGCRGRRSTSPACPRSRSCRGSSPARSSRSRRCRSSRAWVARFLPLTHALALVRWGLLARPERRCSTSGGLSNAGEMAALSLLVVAVFALALTAAAIRVFSRSVVK